MSLVFAVALQESFKTAVLNHITNQLPAEEWIWLRAQGYNQVMGLCQPPGSDLDLRPDQLVAQHITVDDTGLNEILAAYPVEVIDKVEGQPLYYSKKTGLYLWGQNDQGSCLTCWISFPTFLPGENI
jgi:hypothetical protein